MQFFDNFLWTAYDSVIAFYGFVSYQLALLAAIIIHIEPKNENFPHILLYYFRIAAQVAKK